MQLCLVVTSFVAAVAALPAASVASSSGASQRGDRAHGQNPAGIASHDNTTLPDPQKNLPASAAEQALMEDFACTCGTCDFETIATCTCSYAAEMRGKMKGLLKRHDLETEQGRRAARAEVTAEFVRAYGQDVLMSAHADRTSGEKPVWIPLAVFGGAALSLLLFMRAQKGKNAERR